MDRPAIHRSSLPQSWSQPFSNNGHPTHNYPRPLAPQYPHNPHDNAPYAAPALYPTAVSQQMPVSHGYPQQPMPSTLIPGRARTRSYIGDSNPYTDPPPPLPQLYAFPSPAPYFHQPVTHGPVPPSKPPALQSQQPPYPSSSTSQTQDVVPIRPGPMSARRSTSSPAINRIPAPDLPPPVPSLPPGYQSSYPQPTHQRVSPGPPPPPPPSIPIPSPSRSYRSDSSPLYNSPYDNAPSPFSGPPPPNVPPPPFPTSSPPNLEGDIKRAPTKEDDELARAIALSEKESREHSGQLSKEEQDLEKAIKESMKHAPPFHMPISSSEAGPSRIPKTTSPLSFPTPLSVAESPPPHSPISSPHTPHLSASRPPSKVSSPYLYPTQPSMDNDEALAQRLAEEEEERVAASGSSNPRPTPSPALSSPKPEIATPPAPPSSQASRKHREAYQSQFTVVNSDSDPPPPLYHHVVSAQTSFPAKTSPTSSNSSTSLGRSSTASAVISSTSRLSPMPGQPERPGAGRSQSLSAVDTGSNGNGSNPLLSINPGPPEAAEESPNTISMPSPSSSAGPISSPNSFIDQQLLSGVSLGFNAPQISSINTTLKGGVPTVISLPSGRFVPFHIQAPDWRHLLKMMARLSGTRIEASVEALAATKQELKLRTVVQFVKVNATSQDWRTVIYLTIDNPPPSNAPHKFTNGDVNTLPFSYTASPLPPLLRDGPDAPMSKYYTVPATPSSPHPTLPISFPNMAMYLASAVEDSRRMVHDSSGGAKRLAKTLDALYPAQVELGMEDDEPDKPAGGMRNMFKNVFGRGRRDQRRNDDNYADLVTPFVPEWG